MLRISKSKFVAGVQCLKRLYWLVHEPQIAQSPTAGGLAVIEQGRAVGLLARKAFPGGIDASLHSGGLEQSMRSTRELIANREVPAIFEATFAHRGVLVQVDVLQRRRHNQWRLLEVKSTTSLKEHHLYDVGIQSRVLAGCGLSLSSSSLMHVNRDYVYPGGAIDAHKFFRIRMLNRDIAKLDNDIVRQLRTEFRILRQLRPPEVQPGRQCDAPVTCEFFDHCNQPLPIDHVSCLPRISQKTLDQLRGVGVESIQDVPSDFPLKERTRHACTAVQTGMAWYSPDLKARLSKLKYPLFFMDFETVNRAIPPFPGMRPFDALPFQWSVHVLRESNELEHREFLATDASDPRRHFISSLCPVLGRSGSIVVYNAGFESQRLAELARWLPEFGTRIRRIQRRLFDLLPVMRDCVYDGGFGGSYSLKSVLPALIPDMTYAGMAVSNGIAAGIAWESLIGGGLDQLQRNRVEKELREYCGQDTLALVNLLAKLRQIAGDC